MIAWLNTEMWDIIIMKGDSVHQIAPEAKWNFCLEGLFYLLFIIMRCMIAYIERKFVLVLQPKRKSIYN